MADVQIANTFVNGEVVSATSFNTNYGDIVTFVNNRNSAASSWDAAYSTSASVVPLTANNSSGTQAIIQVKDNGTTVFDVLDGGITSFATNTYFRATKADTQTFTADATLVAFGTVTQSGSAFSTSTGRFTAPATGKYYISVLVIFGVTTYVSGVAAYISKNGSQTISADCNANHILSDPICWMRETFNLNAGDYLEVYVNATPFTGATKSIQKFNGNIFGTVPGTWFCGVKVS